MPRKKPGEPEWVVRGKTIAHLIKELQTFEDQTLPVEISTDDGNTRYPISLVGKSGGKCVLFFCGAQEE